MKMLRRAIICPPLTAHHFGNKLISTFKDVTAISAGDRWPAGFIIARVEISAEHRRPKKKKKKRKSFSEKVWEVKKKTNQKPQKRVLVCSCGLLTAVEARFCFVFDKNSSVLKVTDHGLPRILYLGMEFIPFHPLEADFLTLSSLPVSVQLFSGPSLSLCMMIPQQLTPSFSPDVQHLKFSSSLPFSCLAGSVVCTAQHCPYSFQWYCCNWSVASGIDEGIWIWMETVHQSSHRWGQHTYNSLMRSLDHWTDYESSGSSGSFWPVGFSSPEGSEGGLDAWSEPSDSADPCSLGPRWLAWLDWGLDRLWIQPGRKFWSKHAAQLRPCFEETSCGGIYGIF